MTQTSFGFLLLDLAGKVLDASPAACELLGWASAELEGRSLTQLIHPEDRAAAASDLGLVLSGASHRFHDDVRLLARDGRELPLELSVRTVNHGELGAVRAVAEFEGAGAAPAPPDPFTVAQTDALTNLPNRGRFVAELDRLLSAEEPVAVLVIGVDRLGDLKARHGDRAGTAAVLATARLLQVHADARDGVARIDEDGFALLLSQAATEQAMELATYLLEISRAGPESSTRRALSLSIGISTTGVHPARAEELLERAEAAMRQVRHAGGDSYAVGRGRAARPGGLRAVPDQPDGNAAVEVDSILEAVAELDGASVGLVAWELSVSERAVASAWSLAIQRRLLRRARFDPLHREWLYDLTPLGSDRLRRSAAKPQDSVPGDRRADGQPSAPPARARGGP